MKFHPNVTLEEIYTGISNHDYQIEKRRLQVELLKLQQRIIKNQARVAIVFEGRDAAGKGSTIKRFTENLIPANIDVVELGIPTPTESKYWFKRYEANLPTEGQITFFDRSWYSRALIQPTMGYCTEKQYKYFMRRVNDWEKRQIDNGLKLIKLYLSIRPDVQSQRFDDRLNHPLTYWKFSENDIKAHKKWELFTQYKKQMIAHTSNSSAPWRIVNANKKREARLTSMLYVIRAFGNRKFVPLTGEDIVKSHSIMFGGVSFDGLTLQQLAVLKNLKHLEAEADTGDSELAEKPSETAEGKRS